MVAAPRRLRAAAAWATHLLPILAWLPSYDVRTNLLGDVVAGFSVTAVAAPEAVSYAAIAGLPADQGLFTGFLAPLAYALFGSSPQLIVGPTAIMCVLTASAIPTSWGGVPVGAGDGNVDLRVALAGLLCAVVAAIQLIMATLRVGGLLALVSIPVVAGFTTGSALLTASSQFSSLLGLPKCKEGDGGSGSSSCTFPEAIVFVCERAGDVRAGVLGVSACCLALLLGVKFGLPRLLPASRWTAILASLGPLLLVLVSVPIVAYYGPQLEAWGLAPPPPIPAGLPSPRLPINELTRGGTWGDWAGLIGRAAPLALIGYLGGVTIAKTVARQCGPYPIDGGSELLGQAAANAACSVGLGLPVSGSFSRTAVNAASGARSGMACLLSGVFMAVALEVATGPLARVPTVARAAVVIVAVVKLVELNLLPSLWATDRRDACAFLVTLLAVTCWDPSFGLLSGVAFAWAAALLRAVAEPSGAALYEWRGAGPGMMMKSAVTASRSGACFMLPPRDDGDGGGSGSNNDSAVDAGVGSIGLSDYLGSGGGCVWVAADAETAAAVAAAASSTIAATTRAAAAAQQNVPRYIVNYERGADEGDDVALYSAHIPTPASSTTTSSANGTTTSAATRSISHTHLTLSRPSPPPPPPLLLVLRLGPDLQFANAARLAERIGEATALWAPSVLLIDAGGLAGMDSTGAAALLAAAADAARERAAPSFASDAEVGGVGGGVDVERLEGARALMPVGFATGVVTIVAGLPPASAGVLRRVAAQSAPSTSTSASSSSSSTATKGGVGTLGVISSLLLRRARSDDSTGEVGAHNPAVSAPSPLDTLLLPCLTSGLTRWEQAGPLLLAHTLEDGLSAAHVVCATLSLLAPAIARVADGASREAMEQESSSTYLCGEEEEEEVLALPNKHVHCVNDAPVTEESLISRDGGGGAVRRRHKGVAAPSSSSSSSAIVPLLPSPIMLERLRLRGERATAALSVAYHRSCPAASSSGNHGRDASVAASNGQHSGTAVGRPLVPLAVSPTNSLLLSPASTSATGFGGYAVPTPGGSVVVIPSSSPSSSSLVMKANTPIASAVTSVFVYQQSALIPTPTNSSLSSSSSTALSSAAGEGRGKRGVVRRTSVGGGDGSGGGVFFGGGSSSSSSNSSSSSSASNEWKKQPLLSGNTNVTDETSVHIPTEDASPSSSLLNRDSSMVGRRTADATAVAAASGCGKRLCASVTGVPTFVSSELRELADFFDPTAPLFQPL